MNGFVKFCKIWGLFIKSHFVCIHFASDLTVIRLVEKIEDTPDKYFPSETWKTRSLCKCGEMVDQDFVFGVDFKNRNFNSDGTRIEDVK
jgi:hypothetical protein